MTRKLVPHLLWAVVRSGVTVDALVDYQEEK